MFDERRIADTKKDIAHFNKIDATGDLGSSGKDILKRKQKELPQLEKQLELKKKAHAWEIADEVEINSVPMKTFETTPDVPYQTGKSEVVSKLKEVETKVGAVEAHGMSKTEQMVAVDIDGIQFFYPTKQRERAADTIMDLKAIRTAKRGDMPILGETVQHARVSVSRYRRRRNHGSLQHRSQR